MTNAAKFQKNLKIALTIAAVIQLLLSPNFDNIISVIFIYISSWLTFTYLIRERIFNTSPISVLMVLGYNMMTQSGALIFQTFALTPVTFNLQVPITTFASLSIGQITFLLAHMVWIRSAILKSISASLSQWVFRPIGLFARPNASRLWIYGFIGCASIWVTKVQYSGSVGNITEYGNVGLKFLEAFRFLVPAPVIIPFLHYFTENKEKPNPKILFHLGIYFLFVLLTSMAENIRGTFAYVLIIPLLLFFLIYIQGQIFFTKRAFARLAVIFVSGIIFLSIFSDIATAMVIAREQRSEITGSAIIVNTFSNFADKDKLDKFRQLQRVLMYGVDYNEVYIDNPFLSRFVTSKFHDNIMVLMPRLSSMPQSVIWNFTYTKIIALIPTDILTFFNIPINKSDYEYSFGDYAYELTSSTGNGGSFLGGYRTGSTMAHGILLFGYWFYFILFAVVLLIFTIYNGLTIRDKMGNMLISTLALLTLWNIFSISLQLDSVIDLIAPLLRKLPQQILVIFLINFILNRLKIKK